MKKLVSLILALAMVLTLSAAAFAAEPNPETITNGQVANDGTITINGVGADTVYEIYKMLHLESFDVKSGAYSYKVAAAWAGFFDADNNTGALDYVSIDEAGYVTWKTANPESDAVAFAKLALAYAKENGIAPVQSSKNDGEFVITDNSGKFSNLTLGYYLVDSDMGALCGLTTTNRNASINAKNGVPTLDKQVQEDSTNQWGGQNNADIGQTVNFRTTINVHAGAENYVLHDVMSEGLTFDPASVTVTVVTDETGPDGSTVAATNYTVVTTGITDSCTFEVHFNKDFTDSLETNDKIIVHYSAMLNRHAVVTDAGNPNESWLEFGEGHETTHDTTKTYTYSFNIVKTDSQNILIDGAKFRIYSHATEYEVEVDGEKVSTEIAVVPLMEADNVTPVLDENGNPIYRRARADETGFDIVVNDGIVTIVGFDNGTYYLEETAAPDGYNKLTARQRFIIADGNLDATFNNGVYSSGSGVHVVNKTGSMLPETGGMGTVLFLTFGTFVVLATGVLLVTKKRMTMIQD